VARRSNPLLAGLLTTATVVSLALAWSGWRLLDQQRLLDARLLAEQADAVASGMAAGIRERLADVGERLGARLAGAADAAPFEPSVLVVARGTERLTVEPEGALPFLPSVSPPPAASPLFDNGERAEFVAADLDTAAAEYRALSRHRDVTVRASALKRLARVSRRAARWQDALAAARALGSLSDVRVDTTGLPALLEGLDAERLAHRGLGDVDAERTTAAAMARHLDAGTFAIARGAAEFYRDAVSTTPRPENWALAAAMADGWPAGDARAARPAAEAFVTASGRAVVVLLRTAQAGVAAGAAYMDDFLADLAPGATATAWQLVDAEERRIAGAAGTAPSDHVSRVIAAGGTAWTLRLWQTAPPSVAGGRRLTLVSGLAAMLAFVWGATFLMSRALRREAAVRKLQSDFVAAVSHEFRSPLTTMRQMAEMLATDRVPGESRRREYYRVLVAETSRLQRLVETLLNFGRMQAGTERYTFADLDTATLVHSVVAEIQREAAHASRRIAVEAVDGLDVYGDTDAIRLALRNLLDNALKYSPADSVVRVSARPDGDRVAIAVQDDGSGIAADEQAAVFGTFVRGRAAEDARVPGTGVGLAMVRRVVAAHGGEVRLDSEPGRGSTFTVLLPAPHRALAADVQPAPTAHEGTAGS
jgi:signal transduction histidine kinase